LSASLREPQDLTTGSNDWVERSFLIKKTERAYFAKLATQAKSDTTPPDQSSIPASPGWGIYYRNTPANFIAHCFAVFYITLQYFTLIQNLTHLKFYSENKFKIFCINFSPACPCIDPASALLAPFF
jgi:hypothetical protein